MMTFITLDIDGTLFDSTSIVTLSFREGIQNWCLENYSNELSLPTGDEIMKLVGQPAAYIFSTLFPGISTSQQYQLMDYCTAALCDAIRSGDGHIFSNAVVTLRQLHNAGYGLLVASNGQRDYIKAILETHEISHLFSPWTTLEEKGIHGKHELVAHYISTYGKHNNYIMVGDRYSDREAAEKNNIPFIGCAFGHAAEEIAGCRWTAHNFSQIPVRINEIEKLYNQATE